MNNTKRNVIWQLPVERAMASAEEKIALGIRVIVRPTYNEVDDNGVNFYREWRSLSVGAPLKEVVFRY